MKYFFIILFISYCLCTTLYVSSDGSGSSCSSGDPCANLNDAILAYGDNTDDLDLILNGELSGNGNSNITLPNVKVTISSDDTNLPASILCSSNNNFAFTATSDLTISYLNITSCNKGIETSGNIELQLTQVRFSIMDIGIIVTEPKSIELYECYFINCTETAISINSDDTLESFVLSSTSFSSSGAVSISFSDTNSIEAEITGCTFDNIHSNLAISIYEGDWVITDCEFNVCDTAFSYIGSGNYSNVDISTTQISDCTTGILFSGNGPIEVSDSSFSVSDTGVSITLATSIYIHGTTSFSGNFSSPIEITSTNDLDIQLSDLTFTGTSYSDIDVTDNTNGLLENCDFNNVYGAFGIKGGIWGIYDITYTGGFILSGADGGVFSLAGTSNSSFDISNCNINCGTAYASRGGGIYLSLASMAIGKSSFTTCNAMDNGGAIYANNFVALSISDTDFISNSGTFGGAIDFENNDPVYVYVENLEFKENTATSGSAMTCCTRPGACNITLVYSSENTVILSDNVNTSPNGTDVVCLTTIGSFSTAASDPSVNISSSGFNELLLIVIIPVCLMVLLSAIIVTIIVIILAKKKIQQSQYTPVE